MEYEYANVVFRAERSLLGITIVVKEISGLSSVSKISQLKFSPNDINAVVAHFNANMPIELTHPADRPVHLVNLTIVTEAMVRNAIAAFDNS